MTPPTSSASNAARTPRMSRVKIEACSPYGESFAAANASDSSEKASTVATGPKTSRSRTRLPAGTFDSTAGEERARPRDEYALRLDTDLAGIGEGRDGQLRRGVAHVGVGADDRGRVPSELERHL